MSKTSFLHSMCFQRNSMHTRIYTYMYIIYTYMCVYVYDFPSPLELGYESRPIASQAAEAGS